MMGGKTTSYLRLSRCPTLVVVIRPQLNQFLGEMTVDQSCHQQNPNRSEYFIPYTKDAAKLIKAFKA